MGFRLRKHRCLRGLTIRQAAAEVKIAPIRLSQWERNLREPSVGNLVKLAVLYWVMVDELIYDLRRMETQERDARYRKHNEMHEKKHHERPP